MSEWNHFRGDPQQTAYREAGGPEKGLIAWKRQMGRQWYSAPLVDGDRLICACPGRLGNKLVCLDRRDGSILWEKTGVKAPGEAEYPASMRLSSALVDRGDSFFVRALNHDFIFEVAKKDGALLRRFTGDNILDYRSHPQPLLGGDGEYLLYPEGTRSQAGADPNRTDTGVWTHLVCRETVTGKRLWRFRTGQFFSEPLRRDDLAYVGTAEGYLYALSITPEDRDAVPIGTSAVPRIAWQFRAPAPLNSSPAFVDGLVIFGCGDGCVYALDARNGGPRWRCETGTLPREAFVPFSKPVRLGADILIGSVQGKINRISLKTGELLDRYEIGQWVRATPAADNRGVAAVGIDGVLVLLDRQGEELWRRDCGAYLLCSEPRLFDDGVVLIDSGLVIHGYSRQDGREIWSRPLVDYPRDWVAFDEFQASPQIGGDRLFLGTPGRFLYALDKESGETLWRYETGGEIPSDPVVFNGRVYFGQQGGEGLYFCADAAAGKILWKQRLGRVWSAANYGEGRLYVACAEGAAVCLEAETGRILWRYVLGSDLYVAPVLWENLVFFGAWDQWFYALDRETGEMVWRFHGETYLDSGAPAIKDGHLYLPTMGPRFYCLEARTGKELWRYEPEPGWTTNASPAVAGDRVVMTVFISGHFPTEPYEIETRCLDARTGDPIWSFPAGGLNGPVIAGEKVYFGSTIRGDNGFYCVDLKGRGDGTTKKHYRLELGYNVLESCPALDENAAFIYGEDGFLYKIV